MSRRSLGFLALALIVLMGIVATAGLDNLPRDVRTRAQAAVTAFAADRGRFEQNRAALERTLAAEPELFRTQAAGWQTRLTAAESKLRQGGAEVAALGPVLQANRREDREKVEQTLARYAALREEAGKEVAAIRADAQRWLDYKNKLPQQLAAMRADYEAVQAFDIEAAAGPARKAASDWPAKREDLERRIADLGSLKADATRAWESTAESRGNAEARNSAGIDYAALFTAGDQIANASRQLRERSDAVNKLASQLYMGWDKVLADLDEQDGGRQKVRLVRSRYADATLANPQVTQEERWEAARGRINDLERSVGMVIERKSAGKYDSEAERTAQAPGYAYVAPPGQANAYGSWSNGVWTWLPQYLILSQLLRGNSYGPMTSGNWQDYDRYRRRGEVWHGPGGRYGGSWRDSARRGGNWSRASGSWGRRILDGVRGAGSGSGSGGGWYRERPRESGARGGGGFGGSRYQSRGGFGGSRYQSRGFGSRSYSRGFSRGFGRGGRR